ncbi:chloride intracellular channel protein 6-like [Meles meles]|uniref:chloride intracellular channel protein 6-like n=1 Tax=Meles meles TaxID=9662 RepID=UPI001E69A8BE|nr:chloride intracellular channel protein 6-like [Meles meles]
MCPYLEADWPLAARASGVDGSRGGLGAERTPIPRAGNAPTASRGRRRRRVSAPRGRRLFPAGALQPPVAFLEFGSGRAPRVWTASCLSPRGSGGASLSGSRGCGIPVRASGTRARGQGCRCALWCRGPSRCAPGETRGTGGPPPPTSARPCAVLVTGRDPRLLPARAGLAVRSRRRLGAPDAAVVRDSLARTARSGTLTSPPRGWPGGPTNGQQVHRGRAGCGPRSSVTVRAAPPPELVSPCGLTPEQCHRAGGPRSCVTVRADPGAGVTVRADPGAGDTVRADPGAGVTVRADPGAGVTVRADPGAGDTVRADPGAGDTVRADPGAGDTVRADPGAGVTVRADCSVVFRSLSP